MEMKIPMVAISAFVVVVVLAAVLMPVLGDATETEKTFTNDGYYKLTKLDSDSTYKLFWDHTNPDQVTINDTDVISFSEVGTWRAVSIMASDEFSVRYLKDPTNPRIQFYGNATWGFGSASVTNGTDITITVSGGSMTVVNTVASPDTYSVTSTLPADTYAVNKTGDWVMKYADQSAYVLKDTSVITICGITTGNNLEAGVFGTGTVTDGLDYTLFRPASQSETATFSNEVITSTDVNGYVGLVSLSKINFTVTLTGGDLNPVYSYFIVPAEVTAEYSQHLTSNEIALLAAIPALVIIALVIGVVAIFARSKMD